MSVSSSANQRQTAILLLIAIVVMCQCSVHRDERVLDELVDRFFTEYIRFFPIQRCGIGLQDCNDRFDDYAPQQINAMITTFQSFRPEIETIDRSNLSRKSQVNYDLLKRQIDLILFEFDQSKRWQRDAAFYTGKIHDAFAELVTCPLCQDKKNSDRLLKRFQAAPGFVDQAQQNLFAADLTMCQAAIEEIETIKRIIYFYLPQELSTSIADVDSLNALIDAVSNSLENFKTFLKQKIAAKTGETPLFSTDQYQTYLQLSLHSEIDIQNLLDLISSEYQTHYTTMLNAATQFAEQVDNFKPITNRNRIIGAVNEELEKQSVQKHEIIGFCATTLQEVKRFVNEIWNVSLPIDFAVDFTWGRDEFIPKQAIIYLQPPNLFQATKSFHCLLPPIPDDKDWIYQLVFLRKYHKKALAIDVILNAMASHYIIFQNNSAKIPSLTQAFPDEALLNGWSYQLAYAMIDHGYGGYDPAFHYVLLRKYCRLLFTTQLELQYQSGQISRKQAEALITSNGLFKKNEVDELSKNIICFPSPGLKTFWGYYQLKSIEQVYRKKTGAQFSFDFLLNHVLDMGPAPLSVVNDHIIHLLENR